MKFPNHIILESSQSLLKNVEHYWIFSYLPVFAKTFFLNDNIRSFQRFKNKKLTVLTNYFKNEEKFTIVHNYTNKTFLLSAEIKTYYLTLFVSRSKVINKLSTSKHIGKITHIDIKKKKMLKLRQLKILIIKTSSKFLYLKKKNNFFWKFFDINFLKKEHLYTKLKYSRTPQYDMVSGGAAALFAGFLGFLICEKFGLELLDSGDFYFLFMYTVFFFFFLNY